MTALEASITNFEKELRGKLEKVRGTLKHPGTKGAILEETFREVLAEFLPRSTGVSSGEIIDTFDCRSKQTDVVVVSDEHPFTFKSESFGLLMIEGVMAAGEIKSNLTSIELENALKASAEFRTLKMHPGAGQTTHYSIDRDRYQKSPPWFLFAMESQLQLNTIQQKIEDFIKADGGTSSDVNKAMDAVFVLNRGWLVNLGDGNGGYRRRGTDGGIATGWYLCECDTVVFDFLAWLTSVMPRILWSSPILQRYITKMPWTV